MSVKINIITSRLQDLEEMIMAIAKFWGKSENPRLHILLEISTKEIGSKE